MKKVLDACCGSRMMWFDKQDQRAIFNDIRKESHTLCDGRSLIIEPDTECDFRSLPFESETFYHVVFDPPHLTTLGANSWMAKKYGRLSKGWEDDLKLGFDECRRVLKTNGTLIFKWSSVDVPVSKILSIFGENPLYGHKCGKRSNTHWMAFIKG